MASIDTHVIRLHGVHEINTGSLDIMAQRFGGITPFVVPEHQALYNAMMKYKGKYFTMNRIFKKNTSEYSVLSDDEYLEQMALNNHNLQLDYMEFREGNETKSIVLPDRGTLSTEAPLKEEQRFEIGAKGNFRTPSSINYIQYKLNPNARYLEFEFSIPKYLYGHNLAEFIPQGNSDYLFEEGAKYNFKNWNVQKKFLYDRYMKFLNQFFTDLCVRFKLEAMPNLNYVEVRRIDLCYNQYYDTKEKALLALNEKKKLNSKKHRKNQKNINANGYEHSLIYRSSSGSYFKIYHKGSEYIKSDGDLSKHLKINKTYLENKFKNLKPTNKDQITFKELYYDNKLMLEKLFTDIAKEKPLSYDEKLKPKLKELYKKTNRHLPYDTKFLKQEMDKVLRYEVSLRSPFFTYHYKNKFFRKNDTYHQESVNIFKEIKSVYDSRNDKLELKVPKWKHDIYKKMNKYLKRRICLVLNNSKYMKSFETESYNKRYQNFDYDPNTLRYSIGRVKYSKTRLSEKDVGCFSNEMMKTCIDHFKTLISYFEVDQVKPVLDISSKIKEYNDNVERNRERYNSINNFRIYDFRNKRIVKGNKIITKASELLTEKERLDENIQKINPAPLIGIINYLEKGNSMQEYFKLHRITTSSAYRYRKQLEKFKIFENTIMSEKEPIEEQKDYSTYYDNTSQFIYRNKFYFKEEHYSFF